MSNILSGVTNHFGFREHHIVTEFYQKNLT
jgi:hypothetical protein